MQIYPASLPAGIACTQMLRCNQFSVEFWLLQCLCHIVIQYLELSCLWPAKMNLYAKLPHVAWYQLLQCCCSLQKQLSTSSLMRSQSIQPMPTCLSPCVGPPQPDPSCRQRPPRYAHNLLSFLVVTPIAPCKQHLRAQCLCKPAWQ